MKKIEEVFRLHRAKSGLLSQYEKGDVPYVGNGLSDNAVAGLVQPRAGDKVFTCVAISVSAFCEATVQIPPFIACGRAGNGLVVLEPKVPMKICQLAYIAAYINLAVRWRFNWYRQTTVDRIRNILIPANVPHQIRFDVKSILPKKTRIKSAPLQFALKPVALGRLYDLSPGDFHSISSLAPGKTPIVSCGDSNNGVSSYVDAKGKTYRNKLTIAFNGMNTLTAKYHPYEFAAKDDVAVCVPRATLRLTTELFICMMINRERWRYSYYRKCFADKLRRFEISLPHTETGLDEDTMQAVIQSAPYWDYVCQRAAVSVA